MMVPTPRVGMMVPTPRVGMMVPTPALGLILSLLSRVNLDTSPTFVTRTAPARGRALQPLTSPTPGVRSLRRTVRRPPGRSGALAPRVTIPVEPTALEQGLRPPGRRPEKGPTSIPARHRLLRPAVGVKPEVQATARGPGRVTVSVVLALMTGWGPRVPSPRMEHWAMAQQVPWLRPPAESSAEPPTRWSESRVGSRFHCQS